MPRRESHSQKTKWLVRTIVCVVVVFCVLVSVQKKYDMDFGLPNIDISAADLLGGLFPEAPAVEAMAGVDKNVRVHFIDVGQGKSILIEAPEKTVLIDAGENDQGKTVLKYLSDNGIKSIDIAIGTHPHSDHIGGLDTVIMGIPVSSVILPVIPDEMVPTTITYTDLLEAIAEKGLKITPARPGAKYALGNGSELTVLAPLGADYDDLNDFSVVTRLDYGETSFLFTGDASSPAENDMLNSGENLHADVLDAGHHGSRGATTAKFLAAVNPRTAVISCGLDNPYGHPHRELIERLTNHGARILRTDLHGSVVIISDGETLIQ